MTKESGAAALRRKAGGRQRLRYDCCVLTRPARKAPEPCRPDGADEEALYEACRHCGMA
jgi:hypothetical protein